MTEQDVINEEMYEEEDDDLPLQYRRLTAHLQTGSADFNRRLAAYLTNQVAMRSAMEHMVNNSYQPQYPGAPQYQQNLNMFQSPMMPQHSNPHSPMSSYRQQPYPSPHHPNFRAMHGRAYSTAAVPQQQHTPPTPHQSMDHRRMSTPGAIPPSSTPINTDGIKPDPDYGRQTQSATMPNGNFAPLWQDMGPFTTSLPPEAQQMLGPALDPHDPFQAMMMNGSEHYNNSSYYPWHDMSHGVKGMPVHPSAYGMSATLAPAALAPHSEAVSSATTPTTSGPTSIDSKAPSSGIDFNFSQESKGLNLQNLPTMADGNYGSGLGSGQVTPGEAFWDSYVQDDHWSPEVISR